MLIYFLLFALQTKSGLKNLYAEVAELAVFCRALPAEDEAKAEKAQRSKFESEGAIKFWAPQEYRAARLPIKSENKTLYFFNKLNICGGGGIGRRAGLSLRYLGVKFAIIFEIP